MNNSVWVATKLVKTDLEIIGVYSTQELATAACVDNTITCCRMELDKDYTDIYGFDVITKQWPEPHLITVEPVS